ncbi:MAG: hypothetical protein JKX97_05575, partial [Candidatus Lindowbacteria bacterium]|nr:hypothetical protein [Candidatus Lindowbacteria bacterium]
MTDSIDQIFAQVKSGELDKAAALERIKLLNGGSFIGEEPLKFHPEWVTHQGLDQDSEGDRIEKRILLVCQQTTVDWKSYAKEAGIEFVSLKSRRSKPEGRYEANAIGLLGFLKDILKSRSRKKVLVQLIASPDDYSAGLSAMLRTTHIENPRIVTQTILVDHKE